MGKALAVFLILFSTVSYCLSLALGPVLFFSTSDGLSVARRTIQGIPLDLFMAITIPIPLQVSIGVLFMVIWAVFVLCVVSAWYDRGGFLNSIRGVLSESMTFAKTNFLFVMPIVATALLSATVVIQQFQEAEGVPTGGLSLPPDPYIILTNLAFAPIREEFAFRITSIGIPVGILLILLYRGDQRISGVKNRVKLIVLAALSPERAKAKMGYRNVAAKGFLRGISPLEWFLILVSAAVFGLAHWLLGGGWQIGKISTAFMAGFIFGIMFVSYGAYAAILLHWFFNYYFTVIDLANSTYGGMFQLLSSLVETTNLMAGYIIVVVFLLISALKIADYLTRRAAGLSTAPELIP
jgi:hypothetical protein